MKEIKKALRGLETKTREAGRNADGRHSLKDDIGNAGDRAREHVGNARDDARDAAAKERRREETETRGR
jgi:hypothetical protein